MFKNGIKAKVDQAHAQSLVVKQETGIFDIMKKGLKEIAVKHQDGLLEGTDVNVIVEDNVRGSIRLLDAALLLITEVDLKRMMATVTEGQTKMSPEKLLRGVFIEIMEKLDDYVTVSITKVADRVGKTTTEEVADYAVTRFGKVRFKKH